VRDGIKVKQEYTDSNGTLTTYYYAGGSYELQTDGSAETVRQYYALAGVTAGMREGTTFYFFLTDHLGSVVGITDSTGTMVSTTRYSPFGEIRTDVGTVSQTDYGYTFQRNVSGIGLLDYKARYYSTLLGRFIQPDSIIPGAGNPQAFNRYAYSNNNPINFIDPTGHMAQVDDGGSCVGIECIKDSANKIAEKSENIGQTIPWSVNKARILAMMDPIVGYELANTEANNGTDFDIDEYQETYFSILKSAQEYDERIMELYNGQGIDLVKFGLDHPPIGDLPNPSNPINTDMVSGEGLMTKLFLRKSYAPYFLFLDEMNIDNSNPINYEPNFLNMLMSLYPEKVDRAAWQYYKQNGVQPWVWDPYGLAPNGY